MIVCIERKKTKKEFVSLDDDHWSGRKTNAHKKWDVN